MSLAKIDFTYSFWLVELVRKAFDWHLEFGFVELNVVYLEGVKLADV